MKRFHLLLTLAGLAALLFTMPATASAAKAKGKGTVKGKLVIDSGGQAAVKKSGRLKVKVTLKVSGKAPKKLRKSAVKVTLRGSSTVAWSPRSKASLQAKTVRLKPNRAKLVTLKLNPTGKARVADCGAPSFRLTATFRLKGRSNLRVNRSRKLAPQKSLCAVPAKVNLSKADRCDFIAGDGNACLAPFPNDFYTRKDPNSATGKRLDLHPESTPVNQPSVEHPSGVHIAVDDINKSDGFSPGPLLSVRIPGMDSQPAFDQSGIVSNRRMSAAFEEDQPVVLIDAATGERQLIWAELDMTATKEESRNLIIRPGRNLTNGHRYIVAIRDMKDADGKALAAPAAFRLYRDTNRTSNKTVENRRAHFESIFKDLTAAGIKRKSLYLAWDFTVGSTENITGRMLSIRDRAFEELGDTNLTDGTVQGQAPGFTIDNENTVDYTGNTSGDGEEDIRVIKGTYTVPCFLDKPGCTPGSSFNLDADQLPIRIPGNTMEARFTCNIPRSVINPDGSFKQKARPSLYGHGLFGSVAEVTSRNIRQLGVENNVIVCGTDWSGMANEDIGTAINALLDLSKFRNLPDRLQQGFLNWLYLGRLLIHPDGFAANANFKIDGQSVLDTSDLFYYGNSQGGIAGGALTAVATDFTRSVLYVPGMNYSTLLTRSVDFDTYKAVLYPAYPNEIERPSIFAFIQTLWDRGEPNGYANNMTSNPLPNTPAHTVMIEMAYGDHEVANIATEVEARTIGAPIRVASGSDLTGGVVSADRHPAGLVEPWPYHDQLGDLSGPAADGNAFFVWDIGPKRFEGPTLFGTDPAPLTNTPPKTTGSGDPFESGSGINPHDTVIRSSPIIRKQIADFLKTDGKVTDPCASNPCWAAGWQGMP